MGEGGFNVNHWQPTLEGILGGQEGIHRPRLRNRSMRQSALPMHERKPGHQEPYGEDEVSSSNFRWSVPRVWGRFVNLLNEIQFRPPCYFHSMTGRESSLTGWNIVVP